jgi:selenocysteine-specific elongation factor
MIVGTAGHVDFTAFVRDRALSASEGEAMIQRFSLVRLPTPKSEYVITSVVWLRLENAIHTALTAFHADHSNLSGMGFERLRLQLEPRLSAPVFTALLQGLARDEKLSLDGTWVRLPYHEARLSPTDEAVWTKIARYIGGEDRFRPPRVRDIAGHMGLRAGSQADFQAHQPYGQGR